MSRISILLAVLALAAVPAKAQSQLGDVSKGGVLAQKVCAACHLVEKRQNNDKPAPAKTFQEIANNPARTEMSLRVFLSTDHRKMPPLILTEKETDNIIAYILSLK